MFQWFGWILFVGVLLWTAPPAICFLLRRLQRAQPNSLKEFPAVSIIVPACNEGDSIEASLKSLLASDYPDFDILAINDRSSDNTGEIMDRVAASDERCRVIQITELPTGWLGKNHAMHVATEQATGDMLLFTDGDVLHDPAVLRAAVVHKQTKHLHNLCLLPRMLPGGYFENSMVTFFGFAFAIGQQLHLLATRWPFAYVGVGAFNLIDADFYRSFGGHQPLAMDVIDDTKLGKLVKRHGGRQDLLRAPDLLSIRWYDSLWSVITGLEKNGFAALNYSIAAVMFCTVLFFLTMVSPYVASLLLPWPASAGYIATIVLWHGLYTLIGISVGGSVWLAPMFPVGAWLMSFAFWRSAWVTLRQRGVRWRNGFYDLNDLRQGLYR